MKFNRYLFWIFALLIFGSAYPQARGAAAVNLALGKPYTLAPSPNYPYCTDSDDLKQLTDGQFSSGRLWTQRATVGWQKVPCVVITVDLGSVQPICGASYNTAAGQPAVEWPQAIVILVSDDGETYHKAGELVGLSARASQIPISGYATHCFRTEQLKTHGRYVAFLISPTGPFTFVDEIEVFKGAESLLELPLVTPPVTNAMKFFAENLVRFGIERRIRDDVRGVRDLAVSANLSASDKIAVLTKLDAIESEVPNLPQPLQENFRAILPLNETHESVFRTQARLWRASKISSFTIWPTDPYAPLLITQAPLPSASSTLDIAMMQNEFRAGAFCIANSTDFPAVAKMQIQGLPGGVNPSYITVNEVTWTDTKSGIPVAAALEDVKQQEGVFRIRTSPGLIRQVWLTFHPTNLPAGYYHGNILLLAGTNRLALPLTLEVYPLRFPDWPTLHLSGWDYSEGDGSGDVSPSNRDPLIAHLREHFVDSPWAKAAVLEPGTYDQDGKMIGTPDTTRFDQWLGLWPQARQYCVFLSAKELFDKSRMGTREFEKKVGNWITFWANHGVERGLKPQQLTLLLVDEPSQPKQDEIILAWASAIRAARTGVRVWEDPIHANPLEANQKAMEACDVLCPDRVHFVEAGSNYRNYFLKRQEQGTELAFYSCAGPARLLDPYTYYRLQAWQCWQYGAKSSHFWSFGDSGTESGWNEYGAKYGGYVPFFLDASSVTPGKHMEALREGVEDYEYLFMLRNRLEKAEKAGATGDNVNRAKRLLSNAISRVCDASGANAFKWLQKKDRTPAEQVRREILVALTALQ